MEADLIGAVEQLACQLRRYFTTTGNPPVGQKWSFAVPVDFKVRRKSLESDIAVNLQPILRELYYEPLTDEGRCLKFISLIDEAPGIWTQRILDSIEPLRIVAQELKIIENKLGKRSGEFPRFRHLFDSLLGMQWSETVSLEFAFEAGVITETRHGFQLLPMREDFIRDLIASASEAKLSVVPKSISRIAINGQGCLIVVDGKSKKAFTTAQYNVLETLIIAGINGLTKDELVIKSGHTDAVKILKRIHAIDSDWQEVIALPGKPNGRYRVLNHH